MGNPSPPVRALAPTTSAHHEYRPAESTPVRPAGNSFARTIMGAVSSATSAASTSASVAVSSLAHPLRSVGESDGPDRQLDYGSRARRWLPRAGAEGPSDL